MKRNTKKQINRIVAGCLALIMAFTAMPDIAKAEEVSGNEVTESTIALEVKNSQNADAWDVIEHIRYASSYEGVAEGTFAGSEGISCKEGETVYFAVAVKDGYKVKAVKADGTTLTADASGIYTVTDVMGIQTITIDTIEVYTINFETDYLFNDYELQEEWIETYGGIIIRENTAEGNIISGSVLVDEGDSISFFVRAEKISIDIGWRYNVENAGYPIKHGAGLCTVTPVESGTIVVNGYQLAESGVTFVYGDNVTVEAGTDPNNLTRLADSSAVLTIMEQEMLYFRLSCDEDYEIAEVKRTLEWYQGTPAAGTAEADANGIYSLSLGTAQSATIEIKTRIKSTGPAASNITFEAKDRQNADAWDRISAIKYAASPEGVDSGTILSGKNLICNSEDNVYFSVAAKEGYKVKTVKTGDIALTADENGIYTLSNMAEAQTVTIETVEVYTINFEPEEGVTVREDTPEATQIEGSIIVEEGESLSFWLEAEEGYFIIDCWFEGVSDPDECSYVKESDEIYSYEPGESGSIIIATSSFDKRVFEFGLDDNVIVEAGSDPESLEEIFPGDAIDIPTTEKLYFKVTCKPDYKILSAEYIEYYEPEEITAGEGGLYCLPLSKLERWTYNVKVEIVSIPKSYKVVEINSKIYDHDWVTEENPGVNYEITSEHIAGIKKKSAHRIAIPAACKEITLEASGTYQEKPIVIKKDNNVLEAVSTKALGNKKTLYYYTVPAEDMADGETLRIMYDWIAEYSDVYVTYPKSIVAIRAFSVSPEGYSSDAGPNPCFSENPDMEKVDYVIIKEHTLNIIATVEANYDLAAENFQYCDTLPDGKKRYQYSFVVTEDVQIDISAKANYQVTAEKEDGTILSPASKKNPVYKKDEITIRLEKGKDKIAFEHARISANGIEFTEEEQPEWNEATKELTLIIPEKAAGREVKLELTYADDAVQKKVTYVLAVAGALSKVSVAGVTGDRLEQTQAAKQDYKLTLTGSQAYATLKTVVTDEAGGTAVGTKAVIDVTAKTLRITTPAKEEKAVIVITSSIETEADGTEKELCKFIVHSVRPTAEVKKVESSLALHDSISLKLTADSDTGNTEGAYFYYKVEVIPQEDSEKDAKPASAQEKVCYLPKTGVSQIEKIALCDEKDGKAWRYVFKVSLIQSTASLASGVEESGTDNNVLYASPEIKKEFATKMPYYENKLAVTKKNTTVYTGQKNALVAVPKYSGNATYRELNPEVKIYDSNKNLVDKGKIEGTAVDEGIFITVGPYVKAGKYTVEVTAKAGTGLRAAKTTFGINVKYGVTSIYLEGGFASNQVRSLYVDEKKNTSHPIFVSYRCSYAGYLYNKKAEYTLLGYDEEKNKWTEDAVPAQIAKYVSVKSDEIVIDKDYPISVMPKENQFRVRITAADYQGESVVAEERTCESCIYSITNQKTELGNMYIAKRIGNTTKYKVCENRNFTYSELGNSSEHYVIIAKKGIEERAYYQSDDLVDPSLYTIKTNKARVDAGTGKIFCSSVHDNITLTATTLDGERQTKSITFSMDYDKAAAFGINNFVCENRNVTPVYSETDGAYHYNGNNAADIISFEVGVKRTGNEKSFRSYKTDAEKYNYTVSAAGGTVIQSQQYYSIQPTNKKTVITITDKQNRGKKTSYTLINDTAASAKAPSVSTKNILYADGETHEFTYSVKNNQYDYVCIAGKKASYWSYEILINEEKEVWVPIGEDNTFTINYRSETPIEKTYDLFFTFGTLSETDGQFIPQTRPLSVKVKAKAMPDYKPTSTYKIDEKTGFVSLTGKSEDLTEKAYRNSELLNANINGQSNHFTDYFKVENGRLIVKNTLKDIAKTDLTGYITYWNPKTNMMQEANITIKPQNTVYKATAVTIVNGTEILTGYTKVTEGKNQVAASKAYAELSIKGKAVSVNTSIEKDGIIGISMPANEVPAGKYTVSLYVIPKGSLYDKGTPETAEMKEQGIKTSVKVTVVKAAASKGKIKIDSPKLKVAMNQTDYREEKTWVRAIDYNVAVNGAEVESIAWKPASKVPSYLTICQAEEGNQFIITMDKAGLLAANGLGKTKSYKAIISFKNGAKAEEITFKITPPKKVMTFEQAAELIKTKENELREEVLPTQVLSEAKAYLINKCQSLISAEADAVITIEDITFEAPTMNWEGTLKGKISIIERAGEGSYLSEELSWRVASPVQTFWEAVEAVNEAVHDMTVTNETTKEQVQEAIRRVVVNEKIRVDFEKLVIKPATHEEDGRITGTVVLTTGAWSQERIEIDTAFQQ